MGHHTSYIIHRRIGTGCSTKGADLHPFRRAVFYSKFEQVLLTYLISSYSKLLKYLSFADFLLIEDYGKCVLWKESVIARFVERFKKATFSKSYRSISLAISLNIKLWKVCSTKGAGHCSFHRAVYNSYFERVLLMNSICTYSNLLNYFIFVQKTRRLEDYEQGALGML